MAYFTTLLQHQVDSEWRRKIELADARMQLCTSGKEIRDFLNDRRTLNTVSFVIRRYIQQTMPFLLDQISRELSLPYINLTQNLNIPWSDDFNLALANELSHLSHSRGIHISRNTWQSYLSDSPIKMYKDTPFKVAFALQMPVSTTEELLMASGQDTYRFRRPDHFIYYYCQNRHSAYNWDHAQKLLKEYNRNVVSAVFTANDATGGMTNILRNDVKQLFLNHKPDSEADRDLLQYMLQNQREFSGLSLTARKDFLRMAEYLAVLYPTYTRITSAKNPLTGENADTLEEIPVTFSEDGTPQLSELVRALFSTGGWLPTTIGRHRTDPGESGVRTASSLKRREAANHIEYRRAEIDEDQDRPFLNSVQFFVDSYAHHLDAIDRVYRRPANPGNVDRRDIILFTYFFIRKYPELLEDEDLYGAELDHLTGLAYTDDAIDRSMDDMMEQLYDLVNTETDSVQRSKGYLEIFNSMLRHFGMKEMYMPNTWDRFIYMSLFAEDPDYFTEAVLWNTINDANEGEPEIEDSVDSSSLRDQNNSDDRPIAEPKTEAAETDSEDSIILSGKNHRLVPDALKDLTLYNTDMPVDTFGNPGFYLYHTQTGEYIPITRCCFLFGRLGKNPTEHQDYGFATTDRSVSRLHAAIIYYNNHYYLADLSSQHETWLNHQHMNTETIQFISADSIHISGASLLSGNDQIQIGQEIFTFRQA